MGEVPSQAGDAGFYFPFMLSFAAQLAMIGSSRYARYLGISGQTPALALLARNILIGWLMLFLPYVLVMGVDRTTWVDGAGALIGVAAGAAIFTATQWGPGGYRNRASRWPTGRTSPPRPISPNTTMSCGTASSASDDTTAAATARSAAGSPMRRPPATLR